MLKTTTKNEITWWKQLNTIIIYIIVTFAPKRKKQFYK